MADRTVAPDREVPLSPLSTLGVGGHARWFLRARTVDEIEAVVAWAHERGIEVFVLGGGSNLVIADEGFGGLVLQVALGGVRFEKDGEDTLVHAGAGEPWDNVAAAAVSRGLAGIECLSGIPGSVGGTPIQNVGAYGQEVSDSVESVTAFDRQMRSAGRLRAADCGFGYRTSRFRREDANRFVILDVSFRLRAAPPTIVYPDVIGELAGRGAPSVADVRSAVLRIRRRKGMVLDAHDPDTRSVGSFFVNPTVTAVAYERITRSEPSGTAVPAYPLTGGGVKIPAAWLIERAGFGRGYGSGPVGVSSKHPLAIINRGGATARGVLHLAGAIKRAVAERFDVWLRPEPVFVGFHSDPAVDYLQRPH